MFRDLTSALNKLNGHNISVSFSICKMSFFLSSIFGWLRSKNERIKYVTKQLLSAEPAQSMAAIKFLVGLRSITTKYMYIYKLSAFSRSFVRFFYLVLAQSHALLLIYRSVVRSYYKLHRIASDSHLNAVALHSCSANETLLLSGNFQWIDFKLESTQLEKLYRLLIRRVYMQTAQTKMESCCFQQILSALLLLLLPLPLPLKQWEKFMSSLMSKCYVDTFAFFVDVVRFCLAPHTL